MITLKDIIMEDFLNYKKPSMFLITCRCDWKCCIEQHIPITSCQNNNIINMSEKVFDYSDILNLYYSDDITKSIVIGGLEPLLQWDEVYGLIKYIRAYQNENNLIEDDIVIYTGYNKEEILQYIEQLKVFNNIIIKYGRYIPGRNSKYDDILGINLISDNQYSEKI